MHALKVWAYQAARRKAVLPLLRPNTVTPLSSSKRQPIGFPPEKNDRDQICAGHAMQKLLPAIFDLNQPGRMTAEMGWLTFNLWIWHPAAAGGSMFDMCRHVVDGGQYMN